MLCAMCSDTGNRLCYHPHEPWKAATWWCEVFTQFGFCFSIYVLILYELCKFKAPHVLNILLINLNQFFSHHDLYIPAYMRAVHTLFSMKILESFQELSTQIVLIGTCGQVSYEPVGPLKIIQLTEVMFYWVVSIQLQRFLL